VSGSKGNYIIHEEIPYTISHTKAICDNENHCKYFEIFCKNKEIVKISFTGEAVKFPENWEDSRSEEAKNKTC